MFLLAALLTDPALAEETFHYNGPSGTGQFTAAQIADKVAAAPSESHLVWQAGWAEWKEADTVDAITAAAAPPPAPANAGTYSYAGPDGQTATLSAQEIADRVSAAPGGRHLVWQAGWDEWKSADSVSEISSLVVAPPPLPATSSAPPPLPPATSSAPPPLPATSTAPPVTTAPPIATSPPVTVAPETVETLPYTTTEPPTPAEPLPLPGQPGGPEPLLPLERMIEIGGEVRVDGGIYDLTDTMLPDVELSRARLRVDGNLTDTLKTRIEFDIHEEGSGAYFHPDTGTAEGAANALAVNATEVWVRAGGEMGALTAGRQVSAFGTRDWYEEHGAYYMAGAVAGLDLGRRAGLVQHYATGLGAQIATSDLVTGDLQVTGRPGDSVELVGRGSVHPIEMIDVYLSALYASQDDPADRFMYSAAGQLDLGFARVMGEFLQGQYLEGDSFMGYQVAGAFDAELDAGALRQLTLVGTYMAFDPILANTFPDAWVTAGGGPQLYWASRGDLPLATGLTYSVTIPQNIEEPLVHDAVLQVAAEF